MAETQLEIRDGIWRMKVTLNRARVLVEALDIALRSGEIDKAVKGVITAHRNLLAGVASGEIRERDPARWVYIVPDTGPHGEAVTKIGHARDLKQRFARMTDRLTPIKPIAAWHFELVDEAMAHEISARKKYDSFDGGGGREWVKARAEQVVADLTADWGEPDFV